MKFDVYHAVKPTFGVPSLPQNPYLEKVAEVETTSIEEAYRLTNTIDEGHWSSNREVKTLKKTRSTSVGDIIVNWQGIAFYCDIVGWKVVKIAKSKQSNKIIELTEHQINVGLEAFILEFNGGKPLFDDEHIDDINSMKKHNP